jgi:hypothetical protein
MDSLIARVGIQRMQGKMKTGGDSATYGAVRNQIGVRAAGSPL